MKARLYRFPAAALGILLALGMGRTGAALRQELGRAESLQKALSLAESELSRTREPTEREARLLAFREQGLTGPEDLVFFDEGKKPRRRKPGWS